MCEYMYTVHIRMCACVHKFRGYWLWTGTFQKKKKINTDLYSTVSSRGYFPHKRKLWGEKREGQKKETDFKMCYKEKETQGSSLLSLLSCSFLCGYRKGQNDCEAQSRGETGCWIDLNAFTDFFSPHHGGHLTFEEGGWGRDWGDRDKEGGVVGKEGRDIIMKSGNSLEREWERNV